jgi:hypothetical protein
MKGCNQSASIPPRNTSMICLQIPSTRSSGIPSDNLNVSATSEGSLRRLADSERVDVQCTLFHDPQKVGCGAFPQWRIFAELGRRWTIILQLDWDGVGLEGKGSEYPLDKII